jgi:hypothetical protein
MRPSIIIGLGGTGARIVNNVYSRIPETDKDKVAFFVFDTDYGDIGKLSCLRKDKNIIITGQDIKVQDLLKQNPDNPYHYLDKHRQIMQKNLSVGASQVRMLSRLAFESLGGEAFNLIQNEISSVFSNAREAMPTNVYFVSSTCGGTGSGILLQLAFMLKNYINTQYNRGAFTKAITLFPDIYATARNVNMTNDEKLRIRANAYAFFKEWQTYNDIFNGNYEYEEYKPLLNVNIGQLGNLTSLTPDKLKANSPDINDPIDIFVGIDAISTSKVNLQHLENYEQMTEDYLLLELATNIGSTNESRADNALSALKESGGLNKFSSFGTTKLLYPYEDILKFAPSLLLKNTLNERWLHIDRQYNIEYDNYLQKRKTDSSVEEPQLNNFFARTFEEYDQSGYQQNYYKNIANTIKSISTDNLGLVLDEVSYDNKFIEKMKGHLTTEIKNTKTTIDGNDENLLRYFRTEVEKNLDRLEDRNEDPVSRINEIERYKLAYKKSAETIANYKSNALTSYYLNMDDENLTDLTKAKESDFNLAYYILGGEKKQNGTSTPLHPIGVRYFLYKVQAKLKAMIRDLHETYYEGGERREKGLIPALIGQLEEKESYDYYDETEEVDTILAALGIAESIDRKFSILKTFTGRKTKKIIDEYIENANEEIQLIENLAICRIQYSVYTKLERRIQLLIEYWENLFRNLQQSRNEDKDNELNQRLSQFGYQDQSNDTLGIKKLFDKFEEREQFIYRQLQGREFNQDKFETAVTDLLFKDAISSFSKFPHNIKTKEEITDQNFVITIIENLEKELNDLGIFDMSIAEALVIESEIKGMDPVKNITKYLDELAIKAGPFMFPNVNNEHIRTFNSWGLNNSTNEEFSRLYSSEEYKRIFGDTNILVQQEDSNDSENTFASYFSSDSISKYEIIRSNFNYNFSLNNFNAFRAPNGQDQELSLKTIFNSGGSLYKSYYLHKLKQWDNKDVSCHLDKRWDGLFILNDINRGVDQLFEREAKKAFTRGLMLKWFESTKDDNQNVTWKLKFSVNGDDYQEWITHSDGTHAKPTFYNLYEALLDNTSIVLKINGYAEQNGDIISGFWDKQYEYDTAVLNLTNWSKHEIIKQIDQPIFYQLHPNIKYNIFDVCFALHREENLDRIKTIGNELLKLIIDELVDYHKNFYGKADNYLPRLRAVIKEILRSSYYAKNKNFEKSLRKEWRQTIINALQYRTENVEVIKLFEI